MKPNHKTMINLRKPEKADCTALVQAEQNHRHVQDLQERRVFDRKRKIHLRCTLIPVGILVFFCSAYKFVWFSSFESSIRTLFQADRDQSCCFSSHSKPESTGPRDLAGSKPVDFGSSSSSSTANKSLVTVVSSMSSSAVASRGAKIMTKQPRKPHTTTEDATERMVGRNENLNENNDNGGGSGTPTANVTVVEGYVNSTIDLSSAKGESIQQNSSRNIHKHAILVPYRNRMYHYEQFVKFMNGYIRKNFNATTQVSLWLIEQDDQEPFNRGWLANVGLAEIFKTEPETECITIHDIDLIPDTNSHYNATSQVVKGVVSYDKCDLPTQIGSELETHRWSVPYGRYAGGITTLHASHWRKINGFSNDYVGWGGEDDDLFNRIRLNKLLDPKTRVMHRPPKGYGRFRAISQARDHHTRGQRSPTQQVTKHLFHQMMKASNGEAHQRWKYDGLSDLQYTVSLRRDKRKDAGTGFAYERHIKARQQLLEFVHIPKTAGSAIEKAAAKAGIPWGACHFNHAMSKQMNCPHPPNFEHLGIQPDPTFAGADSSLWHLPPHLWNVNFLLGKHAFTVVRNPYDLALSIFYDSFFGYWGSVAEKESPDTLNRFLQDFYVKPPSPIFKLRQTDYVYNQGRQVIRHVLKFENLPQEFAALMDLYNLSAAIQLDKAQFNKAVVGGKKLGIHDLSNRTLTLIEKHYDSDFDRFNYSRIPRKSSAN